MQNGGAVMHTPVLLLQLLSSHTCPAAQSALVEHGRPPSVPSQISSNQYAQLADYARQQHPEAMQQVVRDQPWFLKAMGHPVLMGALAMVASKMMRSRMQQGASSANSKADGLLRRLL